MTMTAPAPRAARVARSRVATARQTTPARLRSATLGLVVLTLASGLLAALATVERQSSTSASWRTAEPLMVTAQAIDSSLSDADTTAAASFLEGRLEPAGLQQRYESDLATASGDVAAAAQQAGTDPAVTEGIRTVSTELPVYAGIVQEADFNERQGFYPLAAAYLAEANNLMRARILPAAAGVYRVEGERLAQDQDNAAGPALLVLALVVFGALLYALVWSQRWLSRQFRRTWNVALAVATVIVMGLGIWAAVAFTAQDAGVSSARTDGSQAVSTYTEARILALRARGDDELTLLTRDSDPSYQADYDSTAAGLRVLLSHPDGSLPVTGRTEEEQLARVQSSWTSYQVLHGQIRTADTMGDLTAAVQLASGTGARELPAVSAQLDGALADGISWSQSAFVRTSSGAAADLDGLVWALGLGTILVLVLVLAGLRPRLAEYR